MERKPSCVSIVFSEAQTLEYIENIFFFSNRQRKGKCLSNELDNVPAVGGQCLRIESVLGNA